ncbi:MAG: metallophosphoesterase [Myxococcota bacterium]|nr:metallophosphoesterase [Myxococcota bacterium]MDW8361348.1 metallophosphoesterase [Myxococcales bacterium]
MLPASQGTPRAGSVARGATMAYLIVGDVHGCLEELVALVDRYGAGRTLVHVGDLVAKGPDSRGVVAYCAERSVLGVRGNHDERILAWQHAVDRGLTPPPVAREHMRVCEELGEREWAYLRALPYVLPLPDVGVVVVHGGLVPGVPLEAQRPEHVVAMRTLRPDGTPSDRLEDGVLWATRWPGPQEVVFGHDAISGLQRHRFATGIDTGCVYGGRLTGYLLPERRLVHVEARRNWSGKPPMPRRVLVGIASELAPGRLVHVPLRVSPRGLPRRAIVLRLAAGEHAGQVRAYVDICRHLPVPLSAGDASPLDASGEHLVCGTHGARYRVVDGYCVEGPCRGTRLESLQVIEEDGRLWVVDETR